MFGASVLVAPIYTTCSANFSCTSRPVYFPALPPGQAWVNVFTNASLNASHTGQNLTIEGARGTFPLFTKGVAPSSIFSGPHSPL